MSGRRQRAGRRLPHPGARHELRLPVLRRQRWRNHTGTQGVDPIELRTPVSVDELQQAVERATDEKITVRMVGSGHSWSDVAISTGLLLLPYGLTGVERVPQSIVRAGVDAARLVSVGSGTTLAEVNQALDREGLALQQMGGYDGQTLAGVVSTSTHGSGIGFGAFPDYVRSIDLVDGTGALRRIEPKDGPSDRAAFARELPGWQLTKDTEEFRAVVCGMGCMGLVSALMIEVRERFELTEKRTISSWADVREQIRTPFAGGPLEQNEHYEFYINPYPRNGRDSNRCIVTTRNEHSSETGPRHRPWVPELLGYLPWLTAGLMQLAGALRPQLIPAMLDFSLKEIACRAYTNVSYEVFNIGSVNNLRAYSGEMAVPTEGNRHIRAIEKVLDVAARYREEGRIYHTSPVACRFVAPSPAYMSMMHERETMMIELIQLIDTDGGTEIIAAHEEALAEVDVRPHWGQINSLSAAQLARSYPELPRWERVRQQLDPHGVFASPFTKRVGITPRGVSS
jgi:FAD/FMN-containing dehydrogenase